MQIDGDAEAHPFDLHQPRDADEVQGVAREHERRRREAQEPAAQPQRRTHGEVDHRRLEARRAGPGDGADLEAIASGAEARVHDAVLITGALPVAIDAVETVLVANGAIRAEFEAAELNG